MASVFDVFGRLLLDDKQFQADAAKSGDKAGATVGERMSASLKTAGIKVLGLAGAAAFGVMTKGALELERAQARFTAETGASADEAARAAKTINRVAGEEMMSLEAVTDVAIRVKRDLGATGDEADALTSRFARFARVTRQDAAEAVSDYDDILDAWGLTAADAAGIQDKLLVSSQKYGGSITANQKALATFAPQLQALGATIDDGIGLLNLFAASGLDASKATFALNTAVKNLKPGQNLNDLIRQVASIEDPTLRAQKAIELFGARGGVSLANVLKPGVDSLAAFAINADDAAGATEKAADAIDSTFSGRIQKALSVAGAALREFGASLGPAITGIASLASLGVAVGLDKALGKVFAKLGAGRAVQAGIDVAGKVLGSRLGLATAAAFEIIIIAALVQQFQEVQQRVQAEAERVGQGVGKTIADGTLEQLQIARAAIAQGLRNLGGDDPGFVDFFWHNEREALKANLAAIDAEIAKRTESVSASVGNWRDNMADDLQNVRTEAKTTGASTSSSLGTIGTAAGKLSSAVQQGARLTIAAIRELRTKLSDEARAIINGFFDPLIEQDQLLVQKDEVAAAKRAAAATKAGTVERHQARLTLHTAQKALEETRLALLESGRLTRKEQNAWLNELREKYKKATGTARTQIGLLIAKIEQLQGLESAEVNITVQRNITRHREQRAEGGPLAAGQVSWVGERGRELWVPETDGVVIPHNLSEAMAGTSSSQVFNIAVTPGRDTSQLAARRFGQSVLDAVAEGLREQTARSA